MLNIPPMTLFLNRTSMWWGIQRRLQPCRCSPLIQCGMSQNSVVIYSATNTVVRSQSKEAEVETWWCNKQMLKP